MFIHARNILGHHNSPPPPSGPSLSFMEGCHHDPDNKAGIPSCDAGTVLFILVAASTLICCCLFALIRFDKKEKGGDIFCALAAVFWLIIFPIYGIIWTAASSPCSMAHVASVAWCIAPPSHCESPTSYNGTNVAGFFPGWAWVFIFAIVVPCIGCCAGIGGGLGSRAVESAAPGAVVNLAVLTMAVMYVIYWTIGGWVAGGPVGLLQREVSCSDAWWLTWSILYVYFLGYLLAGPIAHATERDWIAPLWPVIPPAVVILGPILALWHCVNYLWTSCCSGEGLSALCSTLCSTLCRTAYYFTFFPVLLVLWLVFYIIHTLMVMLIMLFGCIHRAIHLRQVPNVDNSPIIFEGNVVGNVTDAPNGQGIAHVGQIHVNDNDRLIEMCDVFITDQQKHLFTAFAWMYCPWDPNYEERGSQGARRDNLIP